MTKKEMIMEMLEGTNFSNPSLVLKNRCENTKKRIEEIYEMYLKSNKTRNDKVFFINLLVRF